MENNERKKDIHIIDHTLIPYPWTDPKF